MTEYTTEQGKTYPPENYGNFGFMGLAAFKKLMPTDPSFQFLNWRGREDGHHLEGGPTRLITRGKRKGMPTFCGEKVTVIVQPNEIEAEERAYESSTGYCAECVGSGRVFAKWDHKTGTWFRACQKCGGTGKCKP